MLDTTWAAWTLLKRDAKSHFSVQSLSSRPFHFAGARCARAFFFLKRMIRKNRLLRARRLRVFAFFLICVSFCFWRVLPGLHDEEVYKGAKALSPSLSLCRSLSRFIFASAWCRGPSRSRGLPIALCKHGMNFRHGEGQRDAFFI